MAEFQEVMKQRDRMCKHYLSTDHNCENCPLDKARKSTILQCFRYIAEYYQEAENVIMSWAAEHPEPVYPTWVEWLRQNGVVPRDQKCFHDWLLKPIPTDIAEQLGIEPTEEWVLTT